jgi:FixJ family two-component response regulator
MAIAERARALVVTIVDDDRSVLRSLENLLSSAGHDVASFPSARAFLASGCLERTCCLILDLQMPEMSGQELFAHVIRERPVPVIILTAVADDDERDRLLRDGAIAFLTKPFRASEILDAVKTALQS